MCIPCLAPPPPPLARSYRFHFSLPFLIHVTYLPYLLQFSGLNLWGGLKACCVDIVFSKLMHGIVFNWYPSYPLLKTISRRSRGKPLTIDHYRLFLFPHQQAFILIPNSYCPSRCKISQPCVEMGTQIWLLNDPVNKPYIYQPFITPLLGD